MARPARRRRSAVPASLVILVCLFVGVVGLWALAKPTAHDRSTQQELDALRDSSEARAAKATSPASAGDPVLCGALHKSTVGKVRDGSLRELSGLVQSRRDPSVLWSIQDSGNEPELIALRADGRLVGRWTVAGAENYDWEDVATAPGDAASSGRPWLYAADIGDNLKRRDDLVIYRVPEPAPASGGGTTAPAQALHLEYPDGSHDAESFLVDPRRGTLIVVSKGYPGSTYAASRPRTWSGTVRLHRIGDAPVEFATAADVSADGKVVGVRGYFNVAFWARRGNEPLTATMRRKACTSPTGMDDGQGEALALSRGGGTALIVAEGERPPIHQLAPR